MTLGKISDKDMRHCHYLKSTCDIGDPPSRAPLMNEGGVLYRVRGPPKRATNLRKQGKGPPNREGEQGLGWSSLFPPTLVSIAGRL